jgi:hypothetical protein
MFSVKGQMHKRSKDHSRPMHSLLIVPGLSHLRAVLKAYLLFHVSKLAISVSILS